MKGKLTLLLIALVALAGGGAIAANTVTLFDDGDPLYNGGIYDLEGVGRPAQAATPAGYTYDGQRYLTLLNDPVRDTAGLANRVVAFIRNDVGLDHSQDWYITMDITNDYIMPDYGFSMWLVGSKPDATWLNRSIGAMRDPSIMTWSWGCGDQLPGDVSRGGFAGDYMSPSGLVAFTPLMAPRLDPDPDETILRGGHNYVTLQWIAASQTYYWAFSNINGARTFSVPGSLLALHPSETYFLAGAPLTGSKSGLTIFKMSYGQGVIPEPGSLAALGLGLTGLLGFARRRR